MRHRWTPEEIRELTALAADGVPAEEIARRLGRSAEAVKVFAKKHGIRRVGGNTLWSPAEEAALREDWRDSELSRWVLQKRYHRSWSALKQRAQKLRLGPRPISDLYVTRGDLIEALGVSASRVQSWIQQGLPVHHSRTNRTYGPLFDVDEVLAFLEEHQEAFDGRYVDPDFFYRMPSWLREKCRTDHASGAWKRKQPWTQEDDWRLRHLFQTGMTDGELGREMGRSESSIRSRRFVLGLSRRGGGKGE